MVRVLLLGVYTGTRSGAAFALKWLPSPSSGWIDVENGILHRMGSGGLESKKRQPLVRIHHRLLRFLRAWKASDMASGNPR
jgi:hypothetical protein